MMSVKNPLKRTIQNDPPSQSCFLLVPSSNPSTSTVTQMWLILFHFYLTLHPSPTQLLLLSSPASSPPPTLGPASIASLEYFVFRRSACWKSFPAHRFLFYHLDTQPLPIH